MKTVTFYSLATPDNPEFGYGDYVDVREGGLVLWGSHASCCPNPYKLNSQGHPIPWKLVYDWIDYQEATWECVDHPADPRQFGFLPVPPEWINTSVNVEPSLFLTGFRLLTSPPLLISKHLPYLWCITLGPDLWPDFMELFTLCEKGELHVKPLIEDLI